jgi:plastocyanin
MERVIYMAAVEPKGDTTVDGEPFPMTPLPAGGSYELKPPDATGRWEVETYRWAPGTLVTYQGDRVTLEIIGVNGREHQLRIDGYELTGTVTRGKLTQLSFTADRPGIYKISCDIHRPSMQADLVVLAR